ncbi:transcription factor/nuclear export subunit protein 2 domain-containing protein [Trichoderma novae-zelandiae]
MPPKRKRLDRSSGEGGRPSPHNPSDAAFALHDRDDSMNHMNQGQGQGRGRGRGGHRGVNQRNSSRGQNGRGGPHNHQQNQNQTQSQSQVPNQAQAQAQAQSQSQPPASRRPSSSSSQPTPQPSPAPQRAPNTPSVTKPPPPAFSRPPPASPPPTNFSPLESTSESAPPPGSKYHYDNLTEEKIRSWAERGREEIVRHGVQSREDVDITELSSLFQEFIYAVVENRLDATDAGTCVKEILGDESTEVTKDFYVAPHTLLLDSLAIVMDNQPDLYRPALRNFLIATEVSPALMRQVLDAPILQQLGLIRDTFARLGVRQATNLLYRQANYNLLREETEGYSKLVTEIFTTSSIPSPSPDLAEQTFERVKALIGTFDLDVGRVLDVTLDVAAAVLIKQFKFFVKFLRVSSWWPRSHLLLSSSAHAIGGLPTWAQPDYPHWNTSEEDEEINARHRLARDIAFWARAREVHLAAYFELGGREVSNLAAYRSKLTNGNSGDAAADFEQQWIEVTKTLPPPGNKVAAQLLGFKLLFYYSDLRDPTDVLPANLLYLAALLIKIGFISLTDLYPHLSPPDEQMERVRDEQMKVLEREERASRGGPMNALLMAGVLPQGDDDAPGTSNAPRRDLPKKVEAEQKPATTDAADDKKPLPEPMEQKIRLLDQLLTIGAIPESLFILGKFPWIPEAFPDILSRIHRILHVSMEKVFSESRPKPVGGGAECPAREIFSTDQTGVAKGSVRLVRPPAKKVWRWPYPDKWDTNESQNYRFYWDEWADNIPVCQTVDDIFTLCSTFLNISGVNIGKDETLLSKLASIGAKSLSEDTSESNYARWHDLLRRLLVPALSHTKANVAVVNAVWELLRRYPLTTRYSIYAEWFEGQISRLPAMRSAFARATAETRGTMKRLSLTNISEMAKQLAKTSHSSPGVVFRVAFEQLESYPNLIEGFVECAKYFTDLSYDVLVWSLMNSLGKSRSRTQADHALTTSKWLQALSRFSGKIFKRYSAINPIPVLQYVNDQLQRGNSTDLIILKEFVNSMGGIVDSVDFNDAQILSMAGGERLRRQTLIRGQDKRFDSVRSSKRLIQALTDSKLAARLLLNLAQYRQSAIYKVPEDEAHIKYLSALLDDSHQILVLYLDFIWSGLEPSAFDALVPSIHELISSYGLDTSIAFLIGRSSLSHRLYPWGQKESESAKESTQATRQEATDKEGDVSMSDESKDQSGGAASTNDEQVGIENPSSGPRAATDTKHKQKPDDSTLTLAPLQPIVEVLKETGRPEVWQKLNPQLYAVFWALQLGDLFCPEDMYKEEKDRLESEGQAILRDRSDMSRRGQERKNEKRQELLKQQLSLSMELKEHRQRKTKWMECLAEQVQSLCPDPKVKPDTLSDTLLEQCFLPRALLSPADAEYTYKFITMLHESRAPNFKLMSLYDRLFNANRLRSLIFTSSVREAEYLGRFITLILRDLSRWHKNEPTEKGRSSKDQPRLGAYDKEGKGPSDRPYLGFAVSLKEDGEPDALMEHAQFKDLLFRWHKNLNTALKSCLAGTEWMHIRNALTVLKAVLDYFPAIDFMATQFTAQLQKISKQEAASKTAAENEEGHRVDLSVAAQGAMSELQKRKSKWVMVQAFRPNAVSPRLLPVQHAQGTETKIFDSNKGGAPQSEADKSAATNLRATATEFQSQAATRSPANRQPTAEREDGEVQDGKAQSASAMSKDTLPIKPSGPKRDVSMSREEGPPRSSTPMGGQGSGPHGPRNDTRPHTLPDRPAHNLPTRPDVPIPSHFTPERYPQNRGHDRRDVRDTRDNHRLRDGRDPRESWESRDPREGKDHRDTRDPRDSRAMEVDRPDRSREYLDRRGAEMAPRDVGPTDLPPRPRQQEREWMPRDSWSNRPQDRLSDIPSQTPSAPSGPAEASEPAMNPQRAALFAQDDPDRPRRGPEPDRGARGRRPGPQDSTESINPERVALIDDRDDAAHGRARDDGRERGPRTQSPRRSGGRYGHEHGPPSGPYEDRHGHPFQQDAMRPPARNARDRSPPGGESYRGSKGVERDGERAHMDKMRDASSSGFHRSTLGQEVDHRPPYQDQNYGRLNPVPTTTPDIPLGPRGRGRGATRNNNPPGGPPVMPNRPDSRYGASEAPRAPSQERHPPSGPASGRGRRGYEPGSNSTGPAAPSGAPGGPHPERMRNFGGGGGGGGGAQENPSAAQGSSTAASAGVHPDRLAQMGGPGPNAPPPPPPPPGPPPYGHGNGPARHSMSSSGSAERPGPRMSAGSLPPLEPAVPTGPASSGERSSRSGGGRRQLAGINNMLQQAQAAMPNEGRPSGPRVNPPRQMLGHSDAQVLAGGDMMPSAPDRSDTQWPDLLSRSGPPNGEDGSGRGEHDRSRRDRGDGRNDRSKRSSRRSSRERERDGKEHSEHRDRRPLGGGVEGATREDRDARRLARDGSSREAPAAPSSGRESRHRGEGGGMGARGGDERSGNRTNRGTTRDAPQRTEEQRREHREDRGRKRRGEEADGALSSDREKRARR